MSAQKPPDQDNASHDTAPDTRARTNFCGGLRELLLDLPDILFTGAGEKGYPDANIAAALARVGGFMDVSRAYVMLDEDGGRFLRNTHEWVDVNIGPAMSSWPLHSYEKDIPSLKPAMKDKPFLATHSRDLPPDLEQALVKQGVTSVLLYPMLRDNTWIGLVGVDSCGRKREWTGDEADILRHLASLVPPALERADHAGVRQRLERIRSLVSSDAMPPFPPLPAPARGEGGGAPSLIEAERQLIVETLNRHRGNRGAAAKQLGIAWAALDRRCKKLGIEVRRR